MLGLAKACSQRAPSLERRISDPPSATNCPASWATAVKRFDVPEACNAQLEPVSEVSTVPNSPTATKRLFPNATSSSTEVVSVFRFVQLPSCEGAVDVKMVPASPAVTQVPFPKATPKRLPAKGLSTLAQSKPLLETIR